MEVLLATMMFGLTWGRSRAIQVILVQLALLAVQAVAVHGVILDHRAM
jgi:hypothetical protein